MISTIDKSTRVTKNTVKAINRIITNSVFDNEFKSSIVQTDISDHFCNFCNHIYI